MLCQQALRGSVHDTQSVNHTAAEVNRGSLWEIARRAGDFADSRLHYDRLRDELVIKDEIVRVVTNRKRQQQFPCVGAKSRVVFGDLRTQG